VRRERATRGRARVADRYDVDLDGVREELVDETGSAALSRPRAPALPGTAGMGWASATGALPGIGAGGGAGIAAAESHAFLLHDRPIDLAEEPDF
jgi:hypothetical protein